MKSLPKLIASIVLCELIGALAIPLTLAAIPTWYATLTKPSFSPPNWIFGPVWTLLYFLIGCSLFFLWNRGVQTKEERTALLYFSIQLVLNFLWPFLFFGLHSPILGLVDIILLLTCIGITIKYIFPISKPAALLLLPYLFWVSFATVLNAAIVAFN
jgi:tryptophan-rich sensory protein